MVHNGRLRQEFNPFCRCLDALSHGYMQVRLAISSSLVSEGSAFTAIRNCHNRMAKIKTIDIVKPNLYLSKMYFFPHPFICQRHFINDKVGNRSN